MNNNKLKIIEDAVKAFADDAAALSSVRANRTSAMITAMRPYVEYVMTGVIPKQIYDEGDRRLRQYRISMVWVEVRTGRVIAESHGRQYDSEGNLVEFGGEVVEGMDSIAHVIAEYARLLPFDMRDFTYSALKRPVENLRSTLSFRGGAATMKRTSHNNQVQLICEIQKVKQEESV